MFPILRCFRILTPPFAAAISQIRLYDTKVKKKPIWSEEFGDHPIMALDVTPDGNYAIFGNSIGEMKQMDLRNGKVG